MVLLETMEAMVPIIATSVGGIPDVVSNREVVLIPPESPTAVAEAVRQVRSDQCAAQTRAQAARQRLEESYAVAPWAEGYDRVYWQALQRTRRH